MDRIVKIDEKDVKFRATARTPRLYRMVIGRDLIVDMNRLSKKYKAVDEAKKTGKDLSFSSEDLQVFEDVAYVMARHATPDMIERTADDWLDSFNMFSIYEILPEILILWGENNRTTSVPKKN